MLRKFLLKKYYLYSNIKADVKMLLKVIFPFFKNSEEQTVSQRNSRGSLITTLTISSSLLFVCLLIIFRDKAVVHREAFARWSPIQKLDGKEVFLRFLRFIILSHSFFYIL